MRPLLVALMVLGLASPAAAQTPVGVLVPYFSGEGTLGRNVSTTLYFQVWRTLRAAPTPNPRKLSFGSGIAFYQTEPLEPPTAAAALSRAQEAQARLVLWGDARPLGDGVVVQAYLATPPTETGDRAETWTLMRRGRRVALGLPRRVFDFSPFVLSQALVKRYQSPEVMKMCRQKAPPCAELPLGDDWRALDHDNVWAHVRNSDGVTGWLHLAGIDQGLNAASDFAAALLSYDRGDFEQARTYFGRVAKRPDAGAAIRQDAAVLAAVAGVRFGAPGLAELERLAADDPYSIYLFQALCMARLQAALARPSGAGPELAELRRLVRANRDVLAPGSTWASDFEAVAAAD